MSLRVQIGGNPNSSNNSVNINTRPTYRDPNYTPPKKVGDLLGVPKANELDKNSMLDRVINNGLLVPLFGARRINKPNTQPANINVNDWRNNQNQYHNGSNDYQNGQRNYQRNYNDQNFDNPNTFNRNGPGY